MAEVEMRALKTRYLPELGAAVARGGRFFTDEEGADRHSEWAERVDLAGLLGHVEGVEVSEGHLGDEPDAIAHDGAVLVLDASEADGESIVAEGAAPKRRKKAEE